ncbi:MAG: hypothetical protein IJ193_08955 [Bacilli bacterium]|nr:hypothetical protein [Bacilli bacterium]
MGTKYYYSAPMQIRCGFFIADAEGNWLNDLPIKSTLVKNLPRVVVCSVLEGNRLSFGYCTCSSNEQYSKKRGQRISYARAIGKPYKVIELDDIKTIHDVSAKIIDEIFDLESKRIYGV